METFANALRRERERADLSQDHLGTQVGLSGARIGQLENGDIPSPDLVFRLEAALGCEPGRLSATLGYVPVGVVPGVIDAINAEGRLDAGTRQILISVFERLIQPVAES